MDFFNFLRSPNNNFKGSFIKDFYIFVGLFLLSILIFFIKNLAANEAPVEEKDYQMLTFSKFYSYVLLIPLIEELCFRGFIKFRKKYILILSFIAYIFFAFNIVKNEDIKLYIILVILITGCIIIFSKNIYNILLKFISNNYKFLIYFSSFCFAIAHFTNYSDFELLNFLPILSKFLGGLFLAYLVSKYNIWYGIFFHSLNNAIPFLIIFISYTIK